MRPRMALGNVVANETMVPYFSKGSSWLISKSSNIFLYKSLFCASNFWRFGVLFCSLYPQSSLITQHWCLTSSPGLLPLMTVICSEREEFITFEIWIFIFQKCMELLQGAFIHPLEPCEGRFIKDAHTLFHVFRTGSSKHPFSPMERLEGARTIFI